uniref:PAS domain S-box protein n=1 Tax=Janthinobacterium sp. TaxID=1871054 RepID=UPI00293D440A
MRQFWSAVLSKRDARRVLYGGVVLSLVLAAALGLVGSDERRDTLAQLEPRLTSRTTANADILGRQIEQLRRDVLFLASVPPVWGMVRASGNAGRDTLDDTPQFVWRLRLETIFLAFAAANPSVFQVRLIGMADGGRELLRVERGAAGIAVVPAPMLQSKGDTEYVRMTARLAARQVYVSDLNLNREHGQIESPPVAVLRAATPLYDASGKLFGMVVLNYDASILLAPLRTNLPDYFSVYLNNGEGDFLLHPESKRVFGFEFGRRWRWQDQFHTLNGAAPGGGRLRRYAAREGVIHAYRKAIALDPLRPERILTYTLAIQDSLLETEANAARRVVLVAMLVGALVVGAALLLYLRQRRAVSQYQARMSAMVENSHDAIIGKTLEGVVTSWNRGAEKMFAFAAEAAIGRALGALIVPPEALGEEAWIIRQVAAGATVSDYTGWRCRRDGSLLAVSIMATPIRGDDGVVVGVAQTVRDVSEQAAADARIRELNASLEEQVRERTAQIEAYSTLQRAILADAPYAVIATDTDGTITLFNPAAQAMLGYAAADLLGRHTPVVFHSADELAARGAALSSELGGPVAPGFEVLVAKARRGLRHEEEWTYVRRDGGRLPVLLSVSALRGEDGRVIGFLGLASDISVRERDRRQLVAARDQLLNAADVAELGIWTWSVADGALEWSERMYTLFDTPATLRGADLNYAHWRARLHPDDVESAVAELQAAVAGAARYDSVFRVVHADGAVRHIQAAASIERDAHGAAVRVLGVNRDVTAQREAEQVLRAAMQAADAANRAKSEFLANMSHEIRSPMHAVLGMLTLLQQSALDARQRDYVGKAETAGRALLGILNDILDFSRVEAGKLRLDPHPFSLDKLLRDVAVILSANVADKDIEILYELDPALPDWVVGDAMRLQQVLINLAGNAIKFTARGEVVVAVRLLRGDDDDQPRHAPDALRLGFSIRDTGIGISAEQCRHIFDGFIQAEASTARRYGGSGLGLAISQRLVHMMGGALKVESETGKGSVFRFGVACERAAVRAPPAGRGGGRRNLRCLLIDQHVAARQSVLTMLRSFDWLVEAVPDGAAALAALERGGAYDAIFVDWNLPDMDAWQASLGLRQAQASGRACLIAMVTMRRRAALAKLQAALPALLDGVLVKPVTPSMLFDAVADAVADAPGARRGAA